MSDEIKVGDKVRVRKGVPRMYLRTMSTKFLGAECGVFEIIDGNAAIASGRDYIAIPLKYLVKVEDEAKEATEEKKLGSITEETIKDKSYWDAYTADLAKEIALKVANKFNGHEEVAEYAVSVAKAVVEELKRK